MEITVSGKTMAGPLLIPSISSFETQIVGSTALKLQTLLREPVSLVSAYDLQRDPELSGAIANYRQSGGVIFIDSGGYESSRVEKYLSADLACFSLENGHNWNFERFKEHIGSVKFDLAASFDVFLEREETRACFEARLLNSLDEHSDLLGDAMVPVVHLRSRKGDRVLSTDDALEVVKAVARTYDPSFIAIPEREMGNGLRERFAFCRMLVDELASCGSATQIHVLGCGNPLTFAVLAHAGIAMADGLEWCRTNCGKNYHLFHFHHFDTVKTQEDLMPNVEVETFKQYATDKIALSLAENLHLQQDFVSRVQSAVSKGETLSFLKEHFALREEFMEALS